MGVLKKELPRVFVVFLIEGTAGDFNGAAEDLDAFARDLSHASSDFGRQNKAWAEQLRLGKESVHTRSLG